MRTRITVREFCEKYLELNQDITVTDYDDEHVYFQGKVKDVITEPTTAFNVTVKRVSPRFELKQKTSIEFEV